MLAKDITYENPFTNEEVTEKHYYHISKADLVEMQLEEHGNTYTTKDGRELTGMAAKLSRIGESEDGKAIIAETKDFIRRSYGKKEGDRFLKSQEIWEEFQSSEAFSQLLFEICTNADTAAEFMATVVPHNLEQIAQEIQEQAEKVAAGRVAQETAKVSASASKGSTPADNGQLSEGTAAVMERLTAENLAERIEAASAENPLVLTQAEVGIIDSDSLKSGLATGRIKFA